MPVILSLTCCTVADGGCKRISTTSSSQSGGLDGATNKPATCRIPTVGDPVGHIGH